MAQKPEKDDPVLRAMQAELDREQAQLLLPGMQRPYFIEYHLDDFSTFEAVANYGALIREENGHQRIVRVTVRIGSYKTDAALKARDPFQNVFSDIANELLAARGRITADALREVRQVTELQFAQDIAPGALSGYLRTDTTAKPSVTRVSRLPADNDPVAQRAL